MNGISFIKKMSENIEGDGICLTKGGSITFFNQKMKTINEDIKLNEEINSFYCDEIGIYFSLKENKRYHVKKMKINEEESLFIFSENKEEKKECVMKEEFYKMNHDLRSPLNAILILSDPSIKKQDLENKLEKINSSAKYMLEIVNSILKRAKDSHENQNGFNLRKTLMPIFEMGETAARDKGQSLSLSLPKEEYCFQGDSLKLRQILLNLMSNAIKYTEKGGKIDIKTEVDFFENKGYVFKAVIRDNGVGMTEKQLEKLFTAFENGSEKRKNSTGLGLYIVKGIVEEMGGAIKAKSELNKGTEFSVQIPFINII